MLKVRNPGPFSDQSPVIEIHDASLIRDIMRLSGLKKMEVIEAADGESISFKLSNSRCQIVECCLFAFSLSCSTLSRFAIMICPARTLDLWDNISWSHNFSRKY